MLKRINWKAIFKGFAWLTCLAGVVVLMGFIDTKKKSVKCAKIEILIPGADNFIEIEEIDAILKQSQGDLIGRNLQGVNLHEIEKSIAANPYIGFVKVYADMNGTVFVEVKQRQPILRILNAGGQDYYVDSDGLKMPVSPNFTANVLVATGNILEGFNGRVDTLMTNVAKDLYKTAMYVKRDTLWDAQIEQLYINDKSDIEMIPRVGNQRIVLGNAKDIGTKMDNLLAFYKQAMPKVGWNAYRSINLKYVNQIVAEKRDSLTIKKLEKPVVLDSAAKQRQVIDAAVQSTIQNEIRKAMGNETTSEEKTTSAAAKTEAKKTENTTDKNKASKSVEPAKSTESKEKEKKTTTAKTEAPSQKQSTAKEKTTTKEKTVTKTNR
ncbi:MAG: cell division protein FtsQ [Pedobacter sp.]|uniref:cell division protein FtsQ/DivIB n=1 Tax=Pedobacter sp. TaxID=1411316 RepID=UPI00280A1585|nr:cell division protein FtsQ [Pedobacter sp.]MDQ8004851.1 cell division protein FtsQ [Pedobacter sp.]